MKLSDFDYHLPESQIAEYPAESREKSRMLVYNRSSHQVEHRQFADIDEYIRPEDFLVVNNTRVMRARLFGHKKATGGKVELLLLKQFEEGLWHSLVKPGRGLTEGVEIEFESGSVTAEVTAVHPDGSRTLRFKPANKVFDLMDTEGLIPLPPYIQRAPQENDYERYQTVYSSRRGSVAAPTAGLHFTPEILGKIRAREVEIVEINLDIGWGTFQPVRVEDPRRHTIETETYRVSPEASKKISDLGKAGKNLLAVGTTSVRTLESWYRQTDGSLSAHSDETDLYIYPPFEFKLVDKLLTNFHLPKSTLLMLVAAFAGREEILEVYREAVAEGYRFFSYGDCMLIL
jgi:S-adenosylmethionine:tRNA ribosyltransferase-isomerase